MSKGGSNLFAFIMGGTIGAVVGILYAPDKGTNTRDKVSYRLGKYKEMLEDFLEDFAEEHEGALSAARSDGEKVVNSAKAKAEQLLSDVDKLLGQIQKKDN